MSRPVRVIVLNTDESFATPVRAHLLSIDSVKIVAEVEEPALLTTALEQFPAEVVFVHLDPDPEGLLQVAGLACRQRPELAVFALASAADGPLVLSAMRAGLREFLTKPIDHEHLAAALRKVADTLPDRIRHGRLFPIIGAAGGVGATTLATNLAVELADLKAGSVALVDLDMRFGQVATFLDIQPSFTISDLCETPGSLDPQMVEKAVNRHSSGVHVLARPNHLTQAETITGAHCATVLGALQELYDYVVVDGPSRFDPAARAVLDMADVSFLVLQLVVPNVRNAVRIREAAQASGYNLERLRLICNRVGKEAGQLSVEHIETTLNSKVYLSIPDDWRAVSTAINLGDPLASSSPKSRVRAAIRELAGRLVVNKPETEPPRKGKKSGRILNKVLSDS